jgi:thiosulfate/3-mercaptopyruvate sulfurtransferase
MRIVRPLSMVAVLAVAAGSISIAGAQASPRGADTVLVSTAWLGERLGRPDLVVIHVGAKDDYEGGHIPGARHLLPNAFVGQSHEGGHEPTLMVQVPALASLDSLLESVGVSDRSRVVVYGRSLTSIARLYMTLDHIGLGSRTSILDGGLAKWREEGKAVSTESPAIARGTLTLSPRANVIADLALVRHAARIDSSAPPVATTIVDARTPEFYTGANAGNMPRAGHIPTAVNIPFSSFVASGTLFKSVPEIQTLFRDAGIQPGASVITYCHIGLQASVAYLAAKMVGLDARMYDGSFDEWSKIPELPVGKK